MQLNTITHHLVIECVIILICAVFDEIYICS